MHRRSLKIVFVFPAGWPLKVLALFSIVFPIVSQAAGVIPPLAIGRNLNGQLVVFRVSEEGDLRHRCRNTVDGAWSPWHSFGGSVRPEVAIVNDADGRMAAFAVSRDDGSLQCIFQLAPNGTNWSSWTNLGGRLQAPVAVGQDLDGRLEVFGTDPATHSVKHIAQTSVGGKWSEWSGLGGSLRAGLCAARNRDGRLEIFGIQSDGAALWHCWQTEPNGGEWSAWASLGGTIFPGIVVAENAVGRLEIFGVNHTNNAATRIVQAAPASSTKWTTWQSFGGTFAPGLAAGQSADQRIELYGVDTNTSLILHKWEDFPNGSDVWSVWSNFDQITSITPTVGCDEDGDLEVFAIDPTNPHTIHYRRQISAASDWLDWANLDEGSFEFTMRSWQAGDGLPDNLVQAIAQTPDGYLWVGTRMGLARFDGVDFARFDPHNTPEIENASITALCVTGDGALWIGTGGGGLTRFQDGVFKHFGRAEGLAGDDVRVVYESNDGSLWIGTTTGMSRYRNKIFVNFTQADGLSSDSISSIYRDRDGNLWIATAGGLNRLKKGGTMDSFAMPNRLPDDSVRAIFQDKGGRIWIGSNNGLLWYDQYWTNHFFAYNTKYGLSDVFVSAICEGHDGNLWVGTYSGLNRFYGSRFYPQLDSEGQPYGKVNALFEDSEGDLWIGTQEGLFRLQRNYFVTFTQQQGLTHNNIMSVLQDRHGMMWIGTWGGGLDQMRGGEVTAYVPTNLVSQDLVLSLCEGRDGSMWVGADFDGGLTRLKDQKITHYSPRDGLPNARIQALLEDTAGNLWIGTSAGLSCLTNGHFTNFTLKNGFVGDNVRAIMEDRSGAVWFGTDGGLGCRRNGQFSRFTTEDGLPSAELVALQEDEDGSIWIGSDGGGLARYKNGLFTTYTMEEGLFSDTVFSILEDDQGWLWMTCPQGVFRVRKSDFDAVDAGRSKKVSAIAYGKADGMESPQCNGAGKPSAWKAEDGTLWFPTTKGLVTVDPQSLNINPYPPKVFIEQMVANHKPLLGESWPQLGRPEAAIIQIPPGQNDLQIQYTVLNLSAPEKSRFKYKLDGSDADWIDVGTRRIAYYNHIAPGPYTFHVRACNKDGVWSESAASLSFVLTPFYWQTWWFQTLAIMALAGAVAGLGIYAARRRVKRKVRVLEQQQAIEKERRRIAKDMHDQLGAGLTQIGLLGEFVRREQGHNGNAAGNVEKICGVTRELAQTLDEIVWAVNPRNDTLNKLGVYLAAYAEDFFQATPVRCRLEIPPGLPATPLSAEVRHNVFLVVKEALNNVAKHAGATEAWVGLKATPAELEICIRDNGTGFSPEKINTSRNGLNNMNERLREIDGTIEIESQPEKGTRICLRVPLKEVAIIK